MLGSYTNFPRNIHRIETFSSSIPAKKIQKALIETMYTLNKSNFSLEDVATPSIPNCRVIFEVGVAEGNDFNYLDEDEKETLVETLNKMPFELLDFLIVVRYGRKHEGGRKTRIRFDYYILRILFGEGLVEMHVFHEKGLRYTSPEELIKLVADRVNATCSRRVLKPYQAANDS
jgi:hypothetical protein